jgi:tight adherence protein B
VTASLPLVAAVLAAGAVLVWPVRSRGDVQHGPTEHLGGRGAETRAGARAAAVAARPHSLLRLARLRRRSGQPGAVEEVQLLDGLAAALEAGLPTGRAVEVAIGGDTRAGAAAPWPDLVRAAREGQPLGPAWQRLARRTGSRTIATVARAWTVASVTGAPVAAAVRSSAHAARERRRLERAVEVATAGARATARVLGLLPLGGVALAAMLGIGPVTLYSHPLAGASAALGVVLLLGGHLLVRRMVRGVLGGVA